MITFWRVFFSFVHPSVNIKKRQIKGSDFVQNISRINDLIYYQEFHASALASIGPEF